MPVLLKINNLMDFSPECGYFRSRCWLKPYIQNKGKNTGHPQIMNRD